MEKIPKLLKERLKKLIPDYKTFEIAWLKKPDAGVRINTLLAEKEKTIKILMQYEIEQLPFYENGFIVKQRQGLGNSMLHYAGHIYIQDISSMIPPVLLEPKPYEYVLDISAAPGSKTTQMADMMNNTGVIIANEPHLKRAKSLVSNIERLGVINAIIMRRDGRQLTPYFEETFDKILIDAPCSSEATAGRSYRVLNMWSINSVKRLSGIQRGLLVNAYKMLKPGGRMVYSTCTFAPEENEEVVSYLLKRFLDTTTIPVKINGINAVRGIVEWEGKEYHPLVTNTLRIYPHKNRGEGFTITVIEKIKTY